MINIVIFGAPGAGKGTVAARVAAPLNARHVSTGAMLREAVKAGTPAGLSAKAYMDKGELVPDQVLADMIGELLSAAPADARFLLDGFPRNVAQAEILDDLAQTLTPDEQRLFALMRQDLTDLEIAERLHLKPRTVREKQRQIIEKLRKIHDRTKAVGSQLNNQ